MIVFLDAFSRYLFPFFVQDQKEAARCLKEFVAFAERQSGHKVLAIHSDNAKEYIEGSFAAFCCEHGIEQQITAPYSSSSNGLVEHVLRTIQENGLASLHHAKLSIGFWPEAFAFVCYTCN